MEKPDLTVLPAEDLTDDDPPADDVTDEDLEDEDLIEDDADLLTEVTDDLVPPVRPLMPEDLPDDADTEVLVAPEPLLERVIDELLTPALLEDDPMPLLPAEPVVPRRGV